MRLAFFLVLLLALTGPALAATVRIDHAAAVVTIVPEARSDVAVTILSTNARLPLRVTRLGDGVRIDGGLAGRLSGCHALLGIPSVSIFGMGGIDKSALPRVVVRAPVDVVVQASGAVYGAVGRTSSLDLDVSGCGDWVVADVANSLKVRMSGSGDVRVGAASHAELSVAGSGDIHLREVGDGVGAVANGAGDITIGRVAGPLDVRVSGSGDVKVASGQVSDMTVEIAGSGDVSFGGVAQTLSARVAGSGDVSVHKVTGAVARSVAGSGDIRVGH